MAFSFMQYNPARLRSYVFRLPLTTRLLTLVIVGFYVASLPLPWIHEWGSLQASKVGLADMHRFNTYAFVHLSFFHVFFNLLAVVPLIERFESEFGSIVTLALFTGPFGLLPGLLYIGLQKFILRGDAAVAGSSVLVFLLLSSEAIKTYRANPHFALGPYKIPTWTTPLFLILTISFLIPNVSLVGHLCGSAIGYLWGLGYIRFLAPPEKVLRWIERKLNLLGRLPHYVSVDQNTFGRYGVLPSSNGPTGTRPGGQRLGA